MGGAALLSVLTTGNLPARIIERSMDSTALLTLLSLAIMAAVAVVIWSRYLVPVFDRRDGVRLSIERERNTGEQMRTVQAVAVKDTAASLERALSVAGELTSQQVELARQMREQITMLGRPAGLPANGAAGRAET